MKSVCGGNFLYPFIMLIFFAGTSLLAQIALPTGKSVSAETIAAYKKLGFSLDSPMDITDTWLLLPKSMQKPLQAKPTFPVFSCLCPPDGMLSSPLPDAQIPFGLSFPGRLVGRMVKDEDLLFLRDLPNLIYLDMNCEKITNKGLKELATHKKLVWLDLQNNIIDDEGLKELSGLGELQYLSLTFCNTSDTGLDHIAPLAKLVRIDLGHQKITDNGLKKLAKLKNLQGLNLYDTPITDEGLKELSMKMNLLLLGSTKITNNGVNIISRQFPDLKILDLSYNDLGDSSLGFISKLKNLEALGLMGVNVTDDGIKNLKGNKNLTALYLSGCRLTDAGLNHLAEMKGLRRLMLPPSTGFASYSAKGMKELKKSLPNCEIFLE